MKKYKLKSVTCYSEITNIEALVQTNVTVQRAETSLRLVLCKYTPCVDDNKANHVCKISPSSAKSCSSSEVNSSGSNQELVDEIK